MEKDIWLLRHGPPVGGGQDVCRGSGLDAELGEEGVRQSLCNIQYFQEHFTRRQLREALVVTSTLQRARYFGEEFERQYGTRHKADDKLTDINVGDWEGLTWDQIRVGWPKEFHLCWNDARSLVIPNGDSVKEYEERVLHRWQHWIAQSRQLLILCLHKCPNKIILSAIDGRTLDFNGQKVGCMNEIKMSNDGQMRIIQEDQVEQRNVREYVL